MIMYKTKIYNFMPTLLNICFELDVLKGTGLEMMTIIALHLERRIPVSQLVQLLAVAHYSQLVKSSFVSFSALTKRIT